LSRPADYAASAPAAAASLHLLPSAHSDPTESPHRARPFLAQVPGPAPSPTVPDSGGTGPARQPDHRPGRRRSLTGDGPLRATAPAPTAGAPTPAPGPGGPAADAPALPQSSPP